MRGGVVQLPRWGLLDPIRAAGTPPIRTTTFHYGSESVEIAIKPRDGADALYAPRRTLLDEVLVSAAEGAGADVVHGVALEGLLWGPAGRVRGAVVASGKRELRAVEADLVIGADGKNSRVARLVGAEVVHVAPHATANIFGYWPGLGLEGNHWHYDLGVATGLIPTNGDEACVFASFLPELFHRERHRGLNWLYHRTLASASPELAEKIRATGAEVQARGRKKRRTEPRALQKAGTVEEAIRIITEPRRRAISAFLVLADYRSYVDAQGEVEKAWRDEGTWTRASILNTARSGRFSSDRSIGEYCREIWKVGPVPVPEAAGGEAKP